MKFTAVLDELGFTSLAQKTALVRLLNYKAYFGKPYHKFGLDITDENIRLLLEIDKLPTLELQQAQLNKFLQENFLRPKNLENAVSNDIEPEKIRIEVIEQLGVLGFIDPIKPLAFSNNKLPTVIFIQGGEEAHMSQSVKDALEFCKNNEDVKLIIPLSSDRKTWPLYEESTIQMLLDQGKIEQVKLAEIIQRHFTPELIKNKNNDFESLLKARKNCAKELNDDYKITWPTEAEIMNRLINANKDSKTIDLKSKIMPAIVGTLAKGHRPAIDEILEALKESESLNELEKLGKINIVIFSRQPIIHNTINVFLKSLKSAFSPNNVGEIQGFSAEDPAPKASAALDGLARAIYSRIDLNKAKSVQTSPSSHQQNLLNEQANQSERRF